jgi:DNA-binding CsgD family transcriptional regulator
MAESLKNQIVKLRLKGKSYKEIASLLQCSIAVISYHCQKNNLTEIGLSKTVDITDKMKEEITIYYKEHSLEETASKFNISFSTVKKYAGKKRIELSEADRKTKAVQAVQKRRKKIKELAIEYKGGKCEKCGYNKYVGAMEFHHLDPNKKDFSLSQKGHCRSWKAVKKELDKCILVCANCHREIHGGLI